VLQSRQPQPDDAEFPLKRELLHGWKVVLFVPDSAVVLSGHLEQFQMPICGGQSALIAQTLHFRSVKRLKS
jgi:hypothetical protein